MDAVREDLRAVHVSEGGGVQWRQMIHSADRGGGTKTPALL